MKKYIEDKKNKWKLMSKEEKKLIKIKNDNKSDPFKYAIVDG